MNGPPDGMYVLGSSLRTRTPEETWAVAAPLAESLGISRVTDITRLDRIGIPVFTGVRPDAMPGSLCVHNGKGLRSADARAGALMEAIEFAWAEPRRAQVTMYEGTARQVLRGGSDAILSLSPKLGAKIKLDAPMELVDATVLNGGPDLPVPAELVVIPYRTPAGFVNCFGSSTNGLASGNTRAEATLHALFELIERDATSFDNVRTRGRPIVLDALPPYLQDAVGRIEAAGALLDVRLQHSDVGLPCFEAFLMEEGEQDARYVCGGMGCHVSPEIALARAVCEAAQSRLTFIHGARDDLAKRSTKAIGMDVQWPVASAGPLGPPLPFSEVTSSVPSWDSLDDLLDRLVALLERHGFDLVLTVPLTPEDYPVQVMRVIAPGLEFLGEGCTRVGRRLLEYARNA